jgi:hypothetical protein
MNLTIDPWTPVVQADGSSELLNLQGLFAQAHELHDLAVKPHERVALMCLLLFADPQSGNAEPFLLSFTFKHYGNSRAPR